MPGAIVPGSQANAETSTGATRFRVAVLEAPFKAAVTLTFWLVVIFPAVAMKEADVAPAATDTECGTVSSALLSDSVTVLPAGGAARFNVTEQVLDALELTLAGLQVRADTSTGATKVKEALWEAPFNFAVRAAPWVVVMVPAVAVKVVDVLLAGTVTDAATDSAELLLESPTTLPPVAAA